MSGFFAIENLRIKPMKKEEEIDRKQENDETIVFKHLSFDCLALAACADQEANAEQIRCQKRNKRNRKKRQYKFRKRRRYISMDQNRETGKGADFDVPQHFFRKQPPCAKKEFEAHMKWLHDNGYQTLTPKEAYLMLTQDKNLVRSAC